MVGWQAVVASGSYLCASQIQGLAVLSGGPYQPKPWQGTLLLWAVIFFAVWIDTVVSSLLPKIESVIMILHILAFFAILIPLVYMGPHGSASDIFTVFLNECCWQTQGLSFMISIIGPVFAF